MAEQIKGWKMWWNRMRNTFRLVIMNDETFEEVGSYRLTLLNVYVWLSILIVAVALFVGALFFFTPIKRYLPGFDQVDQGAILLEMRRELASLEAKLEANELYAERFKKLLVGDIEPPQPQEFPEDQFLNSDSLLLVERIEEDEILRKEIELDRKELERELLNRSVNISPRNLPIEQIYLMPPVSGTISAGFMLNRNHFGVDVLSPKNTPIKSAMDGYVFFSDWTLETGHTIGIQHSNNILTFYKHNSSLLKKVGTFVKAGEAIAIIGNSGTLSSGPHLHFELWHNGKPLDPTDYISFE